jgi:hypothetical protein
MHLHTSDMSDEWMCMQHATARTEGREGGMSGFVNVTRAWVWVSRFDIVRGVDVSQLADLAL